MVRVCAKPSDRMSREFPEGSAAMGSPMRHEPQNGGSGPRARRTIWYDWQSAGALFYSIASNSLAEEKMPAVMNNRLIPDMGIMVGRWP